MKKLLSAIIIDDEARCIDNLQYLLAKHCPDLKVIATSNSMKGLSEIIQTMQFDVAFFDVEIFDDNIFELIEKIGKINFEIVFVTAYDRYAVKAFRVEALDYILKPLAVGDILDCYHKLLKKAQIDSSTINADNLKRSAKNDNQKVILRQGEHIYIIRQHDIFYLKAKGFYTHIYFEQHDKIICVIVSKPISVLEKEYSSDMFFRVHKSFMININKFKGVIKNANTSVQLDNNIIIPIAKRRVNDFLSFVNHNEL